MKKAKKHLIKVIFTVILAAMFFLTACSGGSGSTPENGDNGDNGYVCPGQPEPSMPFPGQATFYNNRDWSVWGEHTGWNLEGQWPNYGIGDPFIMRWNGMFYMYVSTKNTESGIRAWVSEDLINWRQAGGPEVNGLPLGYVVCPTDIFSRRAYAPEVWYWDGGFYLYTSPGGAGHFIYRATHPEGPFERVSNNIGLGIDGSVLIDNCGTKYFTRGHQNGIRIHRMNSMTDIVAAQVGDFTQARVGAWSEGSEIIYRRGTYFMTITGRHVISDGYRVYYNFATINEGETFNNIVTNAAGRNRMRRGMDLPTILHTDDPDFRGLGHNTMVLGPDMDSFYAAYHNLNSSGGPNRSFNLDRMLFNGNQMSIAASPIRSIAPRMPVFAARDPLGADAAMFELDTFEGFKGVSSAKATGAVFSAEFNFSGAEFMMAVVNYTDDYNFDFVEVDILGNTIRLISVVNDAETVVAAVPLIQRFEGTAQRLNTVDAVHAIRFAQGDDGKVDVYFNNLRRIGDQTLPGGNRTGGYIGLGFEDGQGIELHYVAFSDVARGLSDRLEVTQYHGVTGASLFWPEGGSRLGANSGVSAVEGYTGFEHHGALRLTLQAGDYVSYFVNFNQDRMYGLEMTFPIDYAGRQVRISIDGGESILTRLPEYGGEWCEDLDKHMTMRAYVGTLPVRKGIQRVIIESVGGEMSFVSFRFFHSTLVPVEFEHSLATIMGTGSDYRTIWRIDDEAGAHRAMGGTRQLVFIGDRSIRNFELNIEIATVAANAANHGGIIFRADNYAASRYDDWTSIQGFFFDLTHNSARLHHLNYDLSRQNIATYGITNVVGGGFIAYRIIANGQNIRIYREGVLLINVYDALGSTHGRIGLYTNGAELLYRNLRLSPIA